MNEIEIDHAAQEMQRCIFDVINGLQEAREIRQHAFEQADHWGRELAKLLKGSEMLPREPLHKLDMAAGILENEAPNSSNEQLVIAMSRAMRYTLGLILWGQCHDDYKSGVPRVR